MSLFSMFQKKKDEDPSDDQVANPKADGVHNIEAPPPPVEKNDEPEAPRPKPENPIDTKKVKEEIVTALKTVYDPEIPVDIYELGLIYEIKIEEDGNTYIEMTLTAPNCPAAGILPGQVESAARGVEGVYDVKLDLVFDPQWTPERMSEAAKLELGMF